MAKTKTSAKSKTAARSGAKIASRKTKASSAKLAAHKNHPAGEKSVSIDRRRGSRREEKEDAAPQPSAAPPVALERRQKVNRRRQIDPTTCERDYTTDEVEFMSALDDYKRKNGRMFPTCSEVLEVVRSLGYVRLSPNELAANRADQMPDTALVSVAVEEDEITLSRDWQ